jgi:rSAM/selenodomain-associated transferase 1
MKRAIIIMAKVPLAGNVKTRLQNILSPEKCAHLAAAFLQDTENKAKSVCEDTIIAYFPADKFKNLKRTLRKDHIFVEQTGESLGARMFHAFEFAFSQKFDEVVMIGTDSPTFPFDYLEQAFGFLETNSEVVLGKTEDGGFYLMGLRGLHREIFENVAWSSPKTFEQVFENIKKLELHLRETPSWYDVDEEGDLIRLKNEVLYNANAKRRAPNTFDWISKNIPA